MRGKRKKQKARSTSDENYRQGGERIGAASHRQIGEA